jgi:hypothetical protein
MWPGRVCSWWTSRPSMTTRRSPCRTRLPGGGPPRLPSTPHVSPVSRRPLRRYMDLRQELAGLKPPRGRRSDSRQPSRLMHQGNRRPCGISRAVRPVGLAHEVLSGRHQGRTVKDPAPTSVRPSVHARARRPCVTVRAVSADATLRCCACQWGGWSARGASLCAGEGSDAPFKSQDREFPELPGSCD